MSKAEILFYLKQEIKRDYVMELKILKVDKDRRYADGVKYSLVFVNLKDGRKVLMDNHHPKGPHFHLDDEEFDYGYVNDDTLIEDFKKLVFQHFGVKL